MNEITLMKGESKQVEPWGLQERALNSEQAEMLKPGKAVLLVVDAQKAYTDPNEILAKKIVKSTTVDLDEVSRKLPSFIERARAAGIPVVWTRMTEDPNFMSPNYKKKMEIEDAPPISTPGTRGFEYIGEGLDETDPRSKIKPLEGEKEVIKRTYSAFNKTDLNEHLQKMGINTVVIVGAYTSRCVWSTVASAADDGYNVFIVRDLVGTLDKDNFEQNAALNSMGTILGYVPYSKQIAEVWKSSTT